MQFLSCDSDRLLPVLIDGELRVLRCWNRCGESASLPCSLWTQLTTVEAGEWAAANNGEAVIPATLALDSKYGLRSPRAFAAWSWPMSRTCGTST